MAVSIDCSVSRVQFTPDLLPGDITGMSIYNRRTEEFEFRPGPVFANVVIADEINRASPKTQSALLECMAEHQVTVDGVTYGLASPFLVVATQNPIEMDGTYPLPEAQRDRFTARVSIGYPDPAAELTMLDEHAAAEPLEQLRPVADAPTVQAVIEAVRRIRVGPEVRQYCVDLVTATRRLARPPAGRLPPGDPAAGARRPGAGGAAGARVRHPGRRARRRRPRAGPPAVARPRRPRRPALDRRAGARPADAAAGTGTGPNLSVQADPPVRSRAAAEPDETSGSALGAAGRRADRTVLSTRGRCLLAAGVATAACAVPLAERDLLRVGAFAALLPLLGPAARAGHPADRARAPDADAAPAPGRRTGDDDVAGHGRCRWPARWSWSTPRRTPRAPPPHPASGCRPAAGDAAVHYTLRPVRRGVHRIGPLVAYGTDPLGLAEFARTVPVDPARGGRLARSAGWTRRGRIGHSTERLLVLPRTVALHGIPHALGSSDGAHGAGAAGSGQGRSDVLVRPYRSGDELRRVHWRSTARHDELMVRLEERPWRGGVTVLLDRRAGAHRGHGPTASLEWAVTFAASACVHLIDRGEPVELVTEDGGCPVAPGASGGADGVLDALATLRPSAHTDLGGPALPGSGDVLAILGSTALDELPALLARCPGQGHAVLLDVGSWGSGTAPVFTAAGSPAPVEATAAALRGYRVGGHRRHPRRPRPRTCGTSWCPARRRGRVCRDRRSPRPAGPGPAAADLDTVLGAPGLGRDRAPARRVAGGGRRAGHVVVGIRRGRRRARRRRRPARRRSASDRTGADRRARSSRPSPRSSRPCSPTPACCGCCPARRPPAS